MPLTEVRFSIAGDVQYSRAFELYAHEAGDLSEPFSEIADSLLLSIGKQFETQGAASGSPWRPLSRSYARWKEENFPGRPILVREGDMRGEMLDRSRTVTVTANRMLYEVTDEKAIWHQQGQGHNPARKMVDLTLQVRRSWDRTLADWVNGLRRGPLRHTRAG